MGVVVTVFTIVLPRTYVVTANIVDTVNFGRYNSEC
jgi:hypothetical protein